MKKQITVGLAAFLWVLACKQNTQPEVITVNNKAKSEVSATLSENKTTQVFTIEGMTCAMGCAASVAKKLKRSQGVYSAQVDFETQKATVCYDADQLDEAQVKAIIESVGDGKSYKVVATQ